MAWSCGSGWGRPGPATMRRMQTPDRKTIHAGRPPEDRSLAATVRRVQVKVGADRYDPMWVHRVMAVVIVARDVVEVDGLRDLGPLIEFPQIAPKVGVIDDPGA